MSEYKELLELMHKHIVLFEELAVTQKIKTEAAQQYDMEKLEECMKKEQADTLALRGYDKKRVKLQESLNFAGMTFQQIIPLLPEEYEYEYSKAFQQLNDSYILYKSTADCAKLMIELNIHRLGKVIEELQNKHNLVSGKAYTQDGSITPGSLSFRDMKI